MPMVEETGYLYLNGGNEWPDVVLSATLENADGLLRLRPSGGGFETAGAFLAGPYQVSDRPTAWFRVQASLAGGALPANSHLQLFTFVSSGAAAPWSPSSATPFTDPGWRPAPRDALDFAVRNAPDLRLFLGGVFRGDGASTPALEQARLFYGRDTYAKFLPPVYREQPAAREFLDRFLGIEQSVLGGIEQTIEDLPGLFDPYEAPAGEPPSWLGWLSGWLTFILDEHWEDATARSNLARAFELYGKRGTVAGLREYLRMYAGVEAHIEEPAREARIWSLGDAGLLGFSTMLAPGPLQGAVLGSSAVVDQSHMSSGETLGSELFEDVAHRFCVRVYCGELTRPGALEAVRVVLEREKPAHTSYELCVIEPMMRVGVQARIGIDSIIAPGPPPAGIGLPLDRGVLAAEAENCRNQDLEEIERN
jgi:phage tail-like protein